MSVAIHVRFVTAQAVQTGTAADLSAWRERSDGFLWVDFGACDDEVAATLRETFAFHPRAVEVCRRRTHLPTFHGYPGYWFLVMHRPLLADTGHVHLLQLEMFIGEHLLVTLHGPHNPEVSEATMAEDTERARDRLASGRFHPATPSELAHGILAAEAREYRDDLNEIATRVAALERRVVGDDLRRPEQLLDHMFRVRHELVTVLTMAGHAHEIFERMAAVPGTPQFDDRALMADLADRFARVRSIGEGERDFLAGVIDYYQTRTATKMTIAMERLAVLAAVTLPVTAIASIVGMNVIINRATDVPQLIGVLLVMAVISTVLLRWTKRQGWW